MFLKAFLLQSLRNMPQALLQMSLWKKYVFSIHILVVTQQGTQENGLHI